MDISDLYDKAKVIGHYREPDRTTSRIVYDNGVERFLFQDGSEIVNVMGKAPYSKENVLHCETGPAYCKIDSKGRVYEQLWFRYGALHREGAPAVIEKTYDDDGLIAMTCAYYINGARHRTDGPALQTLTKDTYSEKWYVENLLYRPGHEAVAVNVDVNKKLTQCDYRQTDHGVQLARKTFYGDESWVIPPLSDENDSIIPAVEAKTAFSYVPTL